MSVMDETLDLNNLIDEFEEMTRNAEEVQKQILKDIIEKNKCTDYLQKYGVNESSQLEDFKAMVPIVTHAELEPYIQRVVDGDKSPVLTSLPIDKLSMSSGTTAGRRKFIPCTEKFTDDCVKVFQTVFAYRNREFPIGVGKTLQFLHISSKYLTESGIPVTSCSTHVYQSPKYKAAMKSIQSMYCCPDEVVQCVDFQQNVYCSLLCGILCRDEIQYVHSIFAHCLVNSLKTFEHIWEEIVVDIRDGVLNSKITIPAIREAMSKLLTPNPELADLVRTICMDLKLKGWYRLVPTLFPNAKYLYTITTGTMEAYVNRLRHYAGDLPLFNHAYCCSEGWMAMNVTPREPLQDTSYVITPNLAYFEFLPIVNTGEEPKPVGLTDVEVGKEYEIILTNYQGFYRYEVGDILKVVGFYNKAPKVKYICRKNLILSLNIDKITERDLQECIKAAAKKLSEEKLEVVDFSSLGDMSTEPGHHIIFLEISGKGNDRLLQECCNILDISLIEVGYVLGRKSNQIGPLELNIIKEGTFKKIQESLVASGASATQFKMPRSVPPGNKNILPIIQENVVSRFFSTSYA